MVWMTPWKIGLRVLTGVVFPRSIKAVAHAGSHALAWLCHFALVAFIVWGLGRLNYTFDLEKVLQSPWPQLHKVWLPLLFALVYVLSWLAFWVWRWLTGQDHVATLFPDIDEAWAEAVSALEKKGIGLADVPTFLILGRPASGMDMLFQAAGITLTFEGALDQRDVPVQVFASREAIFVTCPEASLLGRQAKLLALTESPGHLDRPAQSFANNRAETDRWTARLRYLCERLAESRRPYCPINGLVLLIPLAATAGDAEADRIADLTQKDVQAVHQILEIDCPVFVLVCDLERAPGFRELSEQLPDALRGRPLGQRFPLVPDVDPHEIQGTIERGVDVLSLHVLSDIIGRHFQTEVTMQVSGHVPAAVRGNIRLYQLLAYLRAACRRLVPILYRGTQLEIGTSAMLAGCYLAATGADAQRDQAFVGDIFQELLNNQHYVAWAPQALAKEASYRRLLRWGYVGLSLVLGIMGWLSYGVVFGGR